MSNEKKLMLITGVNGRIGRYCVKRFKDRFHIIGFDRKQHEDLADIEHILMDVSSDENVIRGLDEVKQKHGDNICSFIHLAAYYSFGEERPELYEEITVKGTQRILRKLQEFNVEQFLFSSTLLVHAPCKIGNKINEDSPFAGRWGYPNSKIRTEHIMHEEHGNIPIVIMRIAGCYDDECHCIPIGENIRRIYEHEFESHLFPGSILHGNPFLHFEDLMDAIELAIEKRKSLPNETTLLIGEDRTVSYGMLQNVISACLDHREFRIFRIPKWVAKEGAWIESHVPLISDGFIQPWMIDVADDNYEIDITRAKELLGWQPKHFVKDDIPLMMELLKEDPLKWYRTNHLKPPHWLEKTVAEMHGKRLGHVS
ncbi:MAG: NAD(P)-dependent oxidoreductase [Waddliaceae bacterium]